MKLLSVLIGRFFGLLFGLSFAGVGGIILLQTAVPTYQSWQAMQSWQSTSAELISLNSANNDTKAVYRYSVAGQYYQGDHVYVAEFKDNIGSYHKTLYKQLKHLKDNRQMTSIWFNPDNPSESIIDRNMRWGLFTLVSAFCSVFILIGLGVCYVSLFSSRKRQPNIPEASSSELREEWQQKKSNPAYEESFLEFARYRRHELEKDIHTENYQAQSLKWQDKKGWQTNRIRSNAKSGMIGMWIFALFWNAISLTPLFVFKDEYEKGNYVVLIALIFPLVGLYLIKLAYGLTREWLRFGVIELEMDPFPGSIGGHVGGSLKINNINNYDGNYKIDLECVYSYVSGSGKNRSRSENIKWVESGLAKIQSTSEGIQLHFRFDVPDNLPEADIEQTGDYTFWRIKVSLETPGKELKREYNIPVFRTQTQSQHIRHDISAQVDQRNDEQSNEIKTAFALGALESTPLVRAVKFTDDGNKINFYYPMFRNKILTLFALIFAGGFGFATFAMNNNFGDTRFFNILISLFSIPFALVALLATIAAIYLPFNNLKVTLAQRQIRTRRRLFFIPIKYNTINLHEIKEMEVKSSGSTGEGSKKIKHYKIIVHGNDGKKFTIAEDIDGKNLAEQFKDFIYKRLQMTF